MNTHQIRVESLIIGYFQSAINGVGERAKQLVEIECRCREKPSDFVAITSLTDKRPIEARFFSSGFEEIRWALKHIPFQNFTVNGELYQPESLQVSLQLLPDLRRKMRAEGYRYLEGKAIFFYHPREEWMCYHHAQRYTKGSLAFTPTDIACKQCSQEIQKLKQRYRSVCSGCRHDYYNHTQQGGRGVPVSANYGCWHLRNIKRGRCPNYYR